VLADSCRTTFRAPIQVEVGARLANLCAEPDQFPHLADPSIFQSLICWYFRPPSLQQTLLVIVQGAILLQIQPLSDKSLLRGSQFLCTSSIDPIRCNPGANLLLGLPRRLAGHPRHCKYPSLQNWLQRAVKRATILQICSYMCSAVLSPHRGPGPAVL
jgi:hypothetical protein